VEERLHGPEVSIFAVVDGKRCAWFAASRDHKRLLEHDHGPNTGGMGAYTPVAEVGPAAMQDIASTMIQPTVEELLRRGIDFRGLLYLGLILTPEGPRVLEYNCRFGDPETQVVVPTFQGDLGALLLGAARGELPVEGALARRGAAVGIVLASEGYPAAPVTGRPVAGIASASADALVFHAGTRREKGTLLTNGGRVVCVVGLGTGLATALARARAAAASIEFEGKQFRRDIAGSAGA
jgi:phosphoribosylamine--glycine ligase